ncbi:hypothetical protein EON65_45785, partial [archaeon]
MSSIVIAFSKVEKLSNHIKLSIFLGNPGRYLKARSNGTLDYSTDQDEASKFCVDALQGGKIIYLISKQFREAVNRGGGVGWYLTLSPQGELFANGVRSDFA